MQARVVVWMSNSGASNLREGKLIKMQGALPGYTAILSLRAALAALVLSYRRRIEESGCLVEFLSKMAVVCCYYTREEVR